MAYSVNFSKRSLKELGKINEPFYSKIKKAIMDLAENPRIKGHKKLQGMDGYRIRVGDYRVIYDIFDDALVVDVITIGHRRNVYG